MAKADLDVSDLPVGENDRTTGRTVSEGEMMVLHHLVGAVSPLHVNADYAAKNTIFGVPIMGGGLVAAIVAADWSHTNLYKRLIDVLGVRATGALGMTVRYKAPFKGGDTIYGVFKLKSARASKSRPGYGVLEIELKGENQKGETLLEGELAMLFDRPGR